MSHLPASGLRQGGKGGSVGGDRGSGEVQGKVAKKLLVGYWSLHINH